MPAGGSAAHHGGVPKPTIRAAGAGDVAALAALCRAWHDEGRAEPTIDPDYDARFAAWYAEQAARHLIELATVDSAVVGYADLEIRARVPSPGGAGGRWGYLDGMYVLDTHRGTGIGAALLAAVLADARRHGLSDVVLHPTAKAVSLYRRAGFETVPADQKQPMRRTV